MFLKTFKFHLSQYFNVSIPLPALHFSVLYILTTLVWSFVLVVIANPNEIYEIVEGETQRMSFSYRLFMLSYELFLVPLYIKRFLDMGWSTLHRDIALLGLMLSPLLANLLSDGGFELMTPVITFGRITALGLTFALFFMPTQEEKK